MPTWRYLTSAGLIPATPDYERRTIRLLPDATIPKGTVMAEMDNFGLFTPYMLGMQPSCVLEYDCKTDGAGRAWYYLAFGTDYRPREKVTAFIKGTFNCSDLVGLDQYAADFLGRLLEGTIGDGLIKIT